MDNQSLEDTRNEINGVLRQIYDKDDRDSDNEDENADITQTCGDMYFSIKLGNLERCKRIIEKERAPGLQQDMVELLHYHHYTEALGFFSLIYTYTDSLFLSYTPSNLHTHIHSLFHSFSSLYLFLYLIQHLVLHFDVKIHSSTFLCRNRKVNLKLSFVYLHTYSCLK